MFIESKFFEKGKKYIVLNSFSSGDFFEINEELVFNTSWFNRYDCCYVFEFNLHEGSRKMFWVTTQEQLLEIEKNFKFIKE